MKPRRVKFTGMKRRVVTRVGDKQGERAATGTQFVVISLEEGEWLWLHKSGKH